MSKGIIIVDIPENCDQCLVRHPGLAYCQIARKSTSHSSTGKPLNEKKDRDRVRSSRCRRNTGNEGRCA